jgi:hypothetical protein
MAGRKAAKVARPARKSAARAPERKEEKARGRLAEPLTTPGEYVDPKWGGLFKSRGGGPDGIDLYILVPVKYLSGVKSYKEALPLLLKGAAIGLKGGDDADLGKLLSTTLYSVNVGPPPPSSLD